MGKSDKKYRLGKKIDWQKLLFFFLPLLTTVVVVVAVVVIVVNTVKILL